ncbi:diguanylate cyclase [Vibrio sp. YMD68]|uniref:sensor domain-containing diguanylate cyclase n=1 Tax=Vibrio sp. YMD68 TaxID=3042300 RepID=UPI00249C19ED|nr:diguanylate cyclase [Vibrio sp. YMD68]WGW01610.1 diguanylate cyclase [Vibrio sp. YMD68]
MPNKPTEQVMDSSLLSKVFEHLDQAVIIASLDRRILTINRAASDLFGYSLDEVINQSAEILYPNREEYLRLGDSRYNPEMNTSESSILVDYQTKFGNGFIGKTSGGVIKDEQGNNLLIVSMISDESASLAAEEALNKLHSITSSRQLDFQQCVHAILQLGIDLFGLPIAIFSQIDGNKYVIKQAIHPEDGLETGMSFELSGTYCSHVYKANEVQGFNHVSKSEIATHPCFVAFGLESYLGAPIFVDGERFGTLNFSSPTPCRPFIRQDFELVKLFSNWVGHEIARENDLRALEEVSQKMESIANTDVLTQLPNRRFSEIRLLELIEHSQCHGNHLSVAIIDFDHFKDINDTYGHLVGDKVLQLFGEIARSFSRKTDFIGRWGGEEFIAVYSSTDTQAASKVLQRIMSQLKNSNLDALQAGLKLTVSIGLTSLRVGDDIDVMLTRADNLLYKAKDDGRNQIQHD